MNPTVSVIIPSHNSGRFLGEAVESVLSQDYPSVELIVVDDGSTDQTQRLLSGYDGRIRHIRQPNQGVSAARNRGIAIATGDLISFLDADDLMLPGKLRDQVARFQQAPRNPGIVNSGWRTVDATGNPIRDHEPWREAPKLDLRTWLLWKPMVPGGLMIERGWLNRVGGFNTNYSQSEDVDLILRLSLAGCRATWLQQPTVAYRQHADSAMQNAPAQAAGILTVLRDFYATAGLPRSVRKLKRTVFYYTTLWTAWHLYRCGYSDEAVSHLAKTAIMTRHDSEHIVYHWFAQFARFASREGCDHEELIGSVDMLRRASGIHDTRWPIVERTIVHCSDVWALYEKKRYNRAKKRLASYADWEYEEIFKMTQHWLLVSPEPVGVESINRFWRDLTRLRVPPPPRHHDIALLHLSGVAQHVWNRRWRQAIRASHWALRTGFRPRAGYVWRRFFRATFRHYILRARPAVGAFDT
jgi:glycosyltransferase involved in cell wall biosynthesis